jgi:hypothetical protein
MIGQTGSLSVSSDLPIAVHSVGPTICFARQCAEVGYGVLNIAPSISRNQQQETRNSDAD